MLYDHRKFLINTKNKLSESYDKLIITLSGGSLTLSMGFIGNILPISKSSYIILLFIAWALFTLSITSVLIEIISGIYAYNNQIIETDKMISGEIKEFSEKEFLSKISICANILSMIFLILGLFVLFIYVSINAGEINVK